jgi:hypothetical protein
MEKTEAKESDIGKALVMRDDFVGTSKTKISSYLNDLSWYRNTLMAIEKKNMKGCSNLDPIREGFYKLL